MQKVSAIIPSFNEERNIAQAIESVLWADEIIVVDSFSTDTTVDIVTRYENVTLIQHEYENSAAQKNWIIPQAKHDWIFLLDADERVTPQLEKEVKSILNKENIKEVGFWIYRSNDFMGKRLNYSGWQGDKVVRLFKKSCRYENKRVHAEIITDNGTFGALENKLLHNTYHGFDHYIAKLNRYAWWQANDLFKQNKHQITPYHLLVKPIARFLKHFVVQQGFRDGFPGFVISALKAYAVATRYVKLWLLKRDLN